MSSGQRKNRIKVNEVIFEQKQLYKHRTKAKLRELTGLSKSTLNVAI